MKAFKIIFYILITSGLTYTLYKTFGKKNIELNKTELIKGKFKSIYESKSARRTSTSYHIELENNLKTLKIIPEYSNCFKFQEFQQDVKNNQEIELRIDNDEKFLSKNIKSIVSIQVNSKEYLSLDCENKSIKNSKIRIPLIMLGGLILIIILKFAERKLIKR